MLPKKSGQGSLFQVLQPAHHITSHRVTGHHPHVGGMHQITSYLSCIFCGQVKLKASPNYIYIPPGSAYTPTCLISWWRIHESEQRRYDTIDAGRTSPACPILSRSCTH